MVGKLRLADMFTVALLAQESANTFWRDPKRSS